MAIRINRDYLPTTIHIKQESSIGYPRVLRVKEGLKGNIKTGDIPFELKDVFVKEEMLNEINVDKLKKLPLSHDLFKQIILRKSDLNLSGKDVSKMKVSAIMRFCAEKEENRVFEFIPYEENINNLANLQFPESCYGILREYRAYYAGAVLELLSLCPNIGLDFFHTDGVWHGYGTVLNKLKSTDLKLWGYRNTDYPGNQGHFPGTNGAFVAYAYKIGISFSSSYQEFLENFKLMIGFVRFLAGREILAEPYLSALQSLGMRFAEYKGKLKEIIGKELLRQDHASNRPRSLPATIEWYCDDLHHNASTEGYSRQPIPWYEELLSNTALPEKLLDKEPESFVPQRKCLVLDADGILWEGVVDEIGVEGIRILTEFQQRVKSLKGEGVLLALNTRNDLALVEEVFKQRSKDMVLKREDFSAIEANWGSKADNLRAISKKLGIGLNSLVFLDDTAQERAVVKAGAPEVFTPEVPEDSNLLDAFLAGLAGAFRQSKLTEEDKKRTELYAAKEKAQDFLESASSREEGLRLLEMKAKIQSKGLFFNLPRLAQITQRTNQFNLTTVRYNEKELEQIIENSNYKVFPLNLRDKFGCHGIVGLIIARKEKEDVYTIDIFALSCRAIGRTIEQSFVALVAKILKEKGASRLKGMYIPTIANEQVRSLYEKLGFRKIGEEKGTTFWEINLEVTKIPPSPWVLIEME